MAPPDPSAYDFDEMSVPELEQHLQHWRGTTIYKSALAKQKVAGDDPKFSENEKAVTKMVVVIKGHIKEKKPQQQTEGGDELKKLVEQLTEQNTRLHESIKVVQKKALRPEREKLPGHDQDWISRKAKVPKVENACKKVFKNADENHEVFFDMKTDLVEPLLDQLKTDQERSAPEVPQAIAEEQQELLEKAKEACEKGMLYNFELAEVALIAFEEGWDVAAAFQKGELIKDDVRKTRLEKVKKEVRKEKKEKLAERKSPYKKSGWDKRGKQCFICKSYDHLATACPQRGNQAANSGGQGRGAAQQGQGRGAPYR